MLSEIDPGMLFCTTQLTIDAYHLYGKWTIVVSGVSSTEWKKIRDEVRDILVKSAIAKTKREQNA